MVKHYLISLPLEHITVHCYFMSNDPDKLEQAYQKLLYETEQRVGEVGAPMLASTVLSPKGVNTVRKTLRKLGTAEVGETLKAAKDFHISIFALVNRAPENAVLNGLH